ncbi:MAG: diguanylate cyclase [Acidobacteria bacterium]|nr:diguanylate cyclase [Acidobacteriota bacterium]
MPKILDPDGTLAAQLLESARLAALHASGLLDTDPEESFDDITALVTRLCEVPIALVSLVDTDRQWFKSVQGLACRETAREGSLCTYTIRQTIPLVVPDLMADERFNRSQFVVGKPHLRAYAGVPLRDLNGFCFGALCAVDLVPRPFSAEQIETLRMLAKQVEAQIALRQRMQQVQQLVENTEALTKDLLSSNDRFCAFMDHSPIVAFIKDADGRMRFYNRRLAALYGVTSKEWLNKTDHEIWPAHLADEYRATDLAVLNGNHAVEQEERSPGPRGEYIYWKSYKFPFTDAHGERFLAGIAIDVTRERLYEEELERKKAELTAVTVELGKLSITDTLTGLPNRRCFDQWLEQCVSYAARSRRPLSLIMLDIDHFKAINDSKGHLFGDEVLREFGMVLPRLFRGSDHICRYGGEEFAILLPDTSPENALMLATRICNAIPMLEGALHGVTVSVGVARWQVGMTTSSLIAVADAGLYEAKRNGRNQAAFSSVQRSYASEEALRSAVPPTRCIQ